MKIPGELKSLIDDGIIQAVLRPLKSGKEASVYVVQVGTAVRCAKVYKNATQRSFQQRAQYHEGRSGRGSRQNRAIGRRTRFGREAEEAAWKNAEVDALYQLRAAGVRVPEPHGFIDGVLLMELITDAEGRAAPGLGEVDLTPEQARAYHRFLVRQVQRMLCAGLIHGDLSEYNVLVGADGPVIIDLPQVVAASANNSARDMLLRDVRNLTATLARFAPELSATRYGEELWALYESGALRSATELTGEHVEDTTPVDIAEVQQVVEHARDEAERRRRGREAAEAGEPNEGQDRDAE